MFDPKIFESFNQKFAELVANSPVHDLEKNAKALMSSTFNKLDLVTREEFDAQREQLLRLKEQIAQLEARAAALEAQK